MRLLNLRHLSDLLRADTLSEKQKFRLILLMLIVQFLRHGLELLTQRPSTSYLIVLGIGALITLLGVHFCFAANRRGDNRNFVERFICLSTVLVLWHFVFYTLVLWLGTYLFLWLTGIGQGAVRAPLLQISVPALTLIVFYVVLRHYIVRTASNAVSTLNSAPIAAP